MTVTDTPKLMTAEELMELPDDGCTHELSRGELVCMAPAAYRSGRIAVRAAVRLDSFVSGRQLGEVGIPDSGFKLGSNPDSVRQPDVWFVRGGRVPADDEQGTYFEGPPDLAVEIVSPTDHFNQIMIKVRDYVDAGTPLVWVIDPQSGSALVFRGDGSYTFLDEDGVLDGGDVLPGFALPLAELLA